jgi:hypothetical protein
MRSGCYLLHLYCDNYSVQNLGEHRYNEFPHSYTDEYGARCRADARRDGWILKRNGGAICPKCAKRLKSKAAPTASA